jgi:signal transduction histidine kinase
MLAEAWRRRRMYECEVAILDRTGQRREVRWNMVSFIPDGDTLELLLLVGSDVTDRLALEKRAADAEAMASLATLTASLAHEIRNPLNAALLQLELLGRHASRLPEGLARDKIGACGKLVTSEIQRLSKLLEEFLGLARPRSLERYPVDVHALCDYVATMQRPQAEAAGVSIRVDVPPDLPRVIGDQPKLTQVLVNLVVNAIDAMRVMPEPPDTRRRRHRHRWPPASTAASASPSPTAAPASTRTSPPRCSPRSSARRSPAPASGWRSSSASSTCTAGRSSCARAPAAARWRR